MDGDRIKEILTVRQREGEGFRRWFLSPYFELIVWYDSQGGPLYGFQLCLSRNIRERAFTWTRDYTSSHHVTQGRPESGYANQSTGVLKGDGARISDGELRKFEAESVDLEAPLRELILAKITDYNARRSS